MQLGLVQVKHISFFFAFPPAPVKSYIVAKTSSGTQGAVSAFQPLVGLIGTNYWSYANTDYLFALVTPPSSGGPGPWAPFDCFVSSFPTSVTFGMYTNFTNTFSKGVQFPPSCSSTYIASGGSTMMASSCSATCVFEKTYYGSMNSYAFITSVYNWITGDCSQPYTLAAITYNPISTGVQIACTTYA